MFWKMEKNKRNSRPLFIRLRNGLNGPYVTYISRSLMLSFFCSLVSMSLMSKGDSINARVDFNAGAEKLPYGWPLSPPSSWEDLKRKCWPHFYILTLADNKKNTFLCWCSSAGARLGTTIKEYHQHSDDALVNILRGWSSRFPPTLLPCFYP